MLEYAIFDHLFDAVMVIDQEGRIRYANESMRQLCGFSQRGPRNQETAADYIELPEECWRVGDAVVYREVGFVTRSGVMGRGQVLTGGLDGGLVYIVLRDVTAEARLQAKYKVQVESNERMIHEWQRLMAGAAALRRMIGQIPPYCDRNTALQTVAGRVHGELGFAEIYLLQPLENGRIEPVGLDKRVDDRLRMLLTLVEKDLELIQSGELVRAVPLDGAGMIWLVAFRPRLERAAYMLAVTSQVPERSDLRGFFEILSAQTSMQIDCSALYFSSMIDPSSGIYNRRFFDARFAIECVRCTDRHSTLSLILVDLEDFSVLNERYGAMAADALMATAAHAIKRRVRGSDFVARFDVQQIAVVLPETAVDDAGRVAESLRALIESSEILVPQNGGTLKPSVSCGVAGFNWAIDQAATVYEAATVAVEKAKSEGGHRVNIHLASAV